MIIDTLANSATYDALHPNFKAAFDYLKSTDLLNLEVGTYFPGEGLKVMVSDKEGVTAEAAALKFECHNKNIDIQVVIRGDETFGWKPRNDCKDVRTEYSGEKDVMFYADVPVMHFDLKVGQFVILYPNDVHAAMIGQGMIKKLVVKVAI
jgi:biofilm protein TabA